MEADPALRDSNPCAHTRLPKGNDTEDDEVFLEPEEYDLLRAHLRADALDIVDALVSTGLRWGEATALQPRDFTFTSKRSTLRVQRAWKRRGEGGTFLGAPKTKKSRRTLVLTPDQVELGTIVTFTQGLAQMLASDGIRVNAVAPGPVWTPLIPAAMPDTVEFGKQPAEMAPAYVFLASPQASYITAEVVNATCGTPLP